MLSCTWYVTLRKPWETFMLGCIASELNKYGVNTTIYTDGGTDGFENLDVLSWVSLRPFEKFFIVTGKGKLWHLWEAENSRIPSWWRIVRARARTMHTKLENSGRWLGHPSLISRALASNGETIIPPAFEAMVDPTGQKWLPSSDEMEVENCNVSEAIKAAYSSLYGIKIIAPQNQIFDEILGSDGYIKKESEEAVAANNPSGAARRHIQDKFAPSESAKKLATLYKKMLGVKE